jgi:Abortive infection C-terminus
LTESQEKFRLTPETIQCGHCTVTAIMRIICEGEDSFVERYEGYVSESFYFKWQILKCLACSRINIFQDSSSSLWEYPVDSETFVQPTYTDVLYPYKIKEKARPLELSISSEVIERAITDMEILIASRRAVSGVDRIHTAVHAYLRAICIQAKIEYNESDNIVKLFKLLRRDHPRLQSSQIHSMDRLLQSFANILDSLNSIRNDASMAHPNENLLESTEAMLVVNVVRTLLRYLDEKLK